MLNNIISSSAALVPYAISWYKDYLNIIKDRPITNFRYAVRYRNSLSQLSLYNAINYHLWCISG